MRFWTIQDPKFLVPDKKFYTGDGRRIMEQSFRPAYHWLIDQMAQRLPNYHGGYPIWMWVEKPDLRRAGYGPRGTKCILLTLEIPVERVLISDFHAWHCVLNNWYLALRQKEKRLVKEKSWERIFDLPAIAASPVWMAGDEGQVLQAVVERIYPEEIISQRSFIA